MRLVNVNGKMKQCFVISEGETNMIVIPIDRITAVDYKRLVELERKGGNMLKLMRDTRMSNGILAIEVYHRLFVTVPKSVKKETQVLVESDSDVVEKASDEESKPRRGRKPNPENVDSED